jgi:hypothetical protein
MPGRAVPVSVSVNGIPALQACSGAIVNAAAAGGSGIPLPGEASLVPVSVDICGYVYSSYRTPTLSVPPPSAPNPSSITLTGRLLGGISISNYSATIGGLPASILAVTANSSSDVSVTLSVPTLPAGSWPVVLTVKGMGNVRSNLDNASPVISIRWEYMITFINYNRKSRFGFIPGRAMASVDHTFVYHPRSIPSPLSNTVQASSGSQQGSFWGGMVLNVTGTGFVPTIDGVADQAAGKTMNITYASGGPIDYSGWTATVLSATTTTMAVKIGGWYNDSITPVTSGIIFRVAVYDKV